MVFEGEESFSYDIDDVWNALHEIDMLTRVLPGCRSIQPIDDDSYTVAVALGIADIKGEYVGTLRVIDVERPFHYIIEGDGVGASGFVNLRMDCRLERRSVGTRMKWTCEANAGGLIASMGGRVLSGVSKVLAKQFFKSFREEMTIMPAAL